MIETMINILRRCVGFPPYKYKIGDVVKVNVPTSISCNDIVEICGKVTDRDSNIKYARKKLDGGFEHSVRSRINKYTLAFRPDDLKQYYTSYKSWFDEHEIKPYEQANTKLAKLL